MTEAGHAHFRRHRISIDIIADVVWLYYSFSLSCGNVEDLLGEARHRL